MAEDCDNVCLMLATLLQLVPRSPTHLLVNKPTVFESTMTYTVTSLLVYSPTAYGPDRKTAQQCRAVLAKDCDAMYVAVACIFVIILMLLIITDARRHQYAPKSVGLHHDRHLHITALRTAHPTSSSVCLSVHNIATPATTTKSIS